MNRVKNREIERIENSIKKKKKLKIFRDDLIDFRSNVIAKRMENSTEDRSIVDESRGEESREEKNSRKIGRMENSAEKNRFLIETAERIERMGKNRS